MKTDLSYENRLSIAVKIYAEMFEALKVENTLINTYAGLNLEYSSIKDLATTTANLLCNICFFDNEDIAEEIINLIVDCVEVEIFRARVKELLKNKTEEQSIKLNNMVLEESQNILIEKANLYNVKSSGKKPMKLGCCYANSAKKMNEGFGYVEGYVECYTWNIQV